MKFRDPKTGKVFSSFEMAHTNFCINRKCKDCVLNNDSPLDCATFYRERQDEAAHPMGYEVVEGPMDKKLSEWTLKELQTYCQKIDCDQCIFSSKHPKVSMYPISGNPTTWDLNDRSDFTEKDIEDAKAILRILPNANVIERMDNGLLYCYDKEMGQTILHTGLFPFLQSGQAISLSKIIE